MKQLLIATGIVFFLGCSSEQPLESSKKVFYYNESAGITSLDPAFTNNQENIWWVNQLFDGLVEMDNDMNVVPLIAKDWQIDSAGTTYTFNLRNDVYFHQNQCFINGTRKVLASDFVFSFNRLLEDDLLSPGTWIFKQCAEDPFLALNDSTLQIKLKQPFPPFLSILTMQYCNVVPKEAIEYYKKDFFSNPVGCGPFRLNFWLENNVLALLKNQDYYLTDNDGLQLPHLDAVKVSFVRDKSAMFLDFLKGNYDMISGLHPSYKDELLSPLGDLKESYQSMAYLQKMPYLKTDYLGILVDVDNPLSVDAPTSIKKIRQAMNLAINREDMVLFIKNNAAIAAIDGFVPPAIINKKTDALKYAYDLNRAKEILTESGYPEGKGLPEIRLATTEGYVELCEFVQNELRKIGMNVVIDVLPTANHRSTVANSKSLFFRKSWIADYGDAENFLSLFYSENFAPDGSNYTHFKNVEFDELYELSIMTTDPTERMELYSKMDSIISEEAPVIPLFYDQVIRFISKDITGLNNNALNLLDLKYVVKN